MATEISDRRQSSFVVPALLLVGGFVFALSWSMQNSSYDVWGALLLAPVILAITAPLAVHIARREEDPALARLLMLALVVKLVGALVRYAVAFGVYDGVADATVYHESGAALSELFRAGIYAGDTGRVLGTGFIKILTGILYTFVGPTRVGGFLAFSWMGFWGLYFFYRAFCIACPDGDRRRYARLVFFLPSLVFWPSSIGKEAWMTLTLGLVALGAAKLLTHARGGFVLLALGFAGATMVRPHVSALLLAALSIAYVLRRNPRGGSPLRPLFRMVGLASLLVAGVVVLSQAERVLGVDEFNSTSVEQVRLKAEGQTTQGGSAFRASPVRSPADFPRAAFSVMFRPLPTEVTNGQSLIAAMEGMLLLSLFVLNWRRLFRMGQSVFSNAYIAFALAYSVLFIYAFSSFGNFGIITRQRVQLLPFALIALAIPVPLTERQRMREALRSRMGGARRTRFVVDVAR